MSKTADLRPIQQAAKMCLGLALSPPSRALVFDDGLAALNNFLGSEVSADEIIQIAIKMRESQHFSIFQQTIENNWAASADANQTLSEENSLAFLQDLFSSLDHAVLYEHSITAGSSRNERDKISGGEMQFPGNMPCWTLHFTLQGKALFLNEQMEVEVSEGEMMLFHPDACYHYGLHPSAESWEHLWVLFQPRPQWSEWLEWEALNEGISHLALPDTTSLVQMERLFRQLIALKKDGSPYQDDLQHNRLEEILIRAKGYSAERERPLRDKRIQSACDYMQSHLAKGFNVDDVAAACNLSTSRLAHLFKEHMGVSPKSWGNNLRLQQARKLLLGNSDSINHVARQVGYEDPSQFTKYFKRNMGCSPREFRRSFREG